MTPSRPKPTPLKRTFSEPSFPTAITSAKRRKHAPVSGTFSEPASPTTARFISPHKLIRRSRKPQRIPNPHRFRRSRSISPCSYTQFVAPFSMICTHVHCIYIIREGAPMTMRKTFSGENCGGVKIYHLWINCPRCKREILVEMNPARGFRCKSGARKTSSTMIGGVVGHQREYLDQKMEECSEEQVEWYRIDLALQEEFGDDKDDVEEEKEGWEIVENDDTDVEDGEDDGLSVLDKKWKAKEAEAQKVCALKELRKNNTRQEEILEGMKSGKKLRERREEDAEMAHQAVQAPERKVDGHLETCSLCFGLHCLTIAPSNSQERATQQQKCPQPNVPQHEIPAGCQGFNHQIPTECQVFNQQVASSSSVQVSSVRQRCD